MMRNYSINTRIIEFFGPFMLQTIKRGMRELFEYCGRSDCVVLDFRRVTFWDPAAILWFSLGASDVISRGQPIKLILPDTSNDVALKFGHVTTASAQRSGDFLRRWRFDIVLQRMGDIEDLLYPEQWDYFSVNRQRYYRPAYVQNQYGEIEEVFSNTLFPFFDFATLEQSSEYEYELSDRRCVERDGYRLGISRTLINGKMRGLYESVMTGIFSKTCGISTEESGLFVNNVIGEALDNMERHPNATFGMMAINRSPRAGTLSLAVVDNGESICNTILQRFNQDFNLNYQFADIERSPSIAASILNYSTYPEVSCRPNGAGMGLYYMKRHTLHTFHGKMEIVTSGISCTYSIQCSNAEPSCEPWPHWWTGNLIRVEIPIGVSRWDA